MPKAHQSGLRDLATVVGLRIHAFSLVFIVFSLQLTFTLSGSRIRRKRSDILGFLVFENQYLIVVLMLLTDFVIKMCDGRTGQKASFLVYCKVFERGFHASPLGQS